MKYTVDYLPDKDIISVKLEGRLNFKLAEQISKDAIKSAKENSCSHFLIDHTETETESGVYKLHVSGDELEEFGFQKSDTIAFITAKHARKNELHESKSEHDKWPTVKFFNSTNVQKAVDWLTNNR